MLLPEFSFRSVSSVYLQSDANDFTLDVSMFQFWPHLPVWKPPMGQREKTFCCSPVPSHTVHMFGVSRVWPKLLFDLALGCWFDRRQINSLVSPILSECLRHSPSSGCLWLVLLSDMMLIRIIRSVYSESHIRSGLRSVQLFDHTDYFCLCCRWCVQV